MKGLLSPDDELGLLNEAFEAELDSWPPGLAAAVRGLPDRLRIRPEEPCRWTARLSPLVVLYPLLNCEGLCAVALADARRATLAHLLILVYAFADDHLLDGQSSLTRVEIVAAREALSQALHILEELGGATVRTAADRDCRTYHLAQLQRFSEIPGQSAEAVARIRRLVVDRAVLGGLATRVLAASAELDSSVEQRVDDAYCALTVALQWEDDIEDWPGDLAAGQDNLLLDSLARNGPPDPPSKDAVEVESALIETGLYRQAFASFRSEIASAIETQRQLACTELVALLEERKKRLERLERDLEREILRDRPRRLIDFRYTLVPSVQQVRSRRAGLPGPPRSSQQGHPALRE